MAEVVVALDVTGATQALRLLDRIPGAQWVKVGPILMTREGPMFIRELIARRLRVFLDLKWHDIPNTVSGAVQAAGELGVVMATVHTLGGETMLRAAAAAAGPNLALVGVTVLTSHDAAGFAAVTARDGVDLNEEAGRLAESALRCGLRGVVCSSTEAGQIRRRLGASAWIVVPGIRRPSDAPGDQVRTATPKQAAQAGATHLVVGRPILDAADPAAAFREFVEAAR